jgi:hypothetical protein
MRSCGTCNLCCKVLAVDDLAKPAGQWCTHAAKAGGCRIYGAHPPQCRAFRCAWLDKPDLDESWKPNVSKMVLRSDLDGRRLCIDVDPGYPSAWRDPRYYSRIKSWAEVARQGVGEVVVFVGLVATVVFPEEDVLVGDVAIGEELWVGYEAAPASRRPFVRLVKTDGRVVERRGNPCR